MDATTMYSGPVTTAGSADDTYLPDDESFVTDARAELRPAQAVETKLARVLKSSLPVSRLARTARPGGR